jgi:hypothetical protein
MKELKVAIDNGNIEIIKIELSNLKGSCGYIGAG